MVRHDVTFGMISSYRFSLFTARDRESQTLSLSLPIPADGECPPLRPASAGSIFVSFLDRTWREATVGWTPWEDPGVGMRSRKPSAGGGNGGGSAGGAHGGDGDGGEGGNRGDGKGSKGARKDKDGDHGGRKTKKVKVNKDSPGEENTANLCDDALYRLDMGFSQVCFSSFFSYLPTDAKHHRQEKPIGRVLTNFGMAFRWGALHSESFSVMLAEGHDEDPLSTPSLSPSIASTTESSPVHTPEALPSPRAVYHYGPESPKPVFEGGNPEILAPGVPGPPPCHRAKILADGLDGTAILTTRLGCGGFATVWGGNLALRGISLAETNVAVKIPHGTAEAEQSLLHEAKIYACLQSKAAPIPRYWGLFHELGCDGQREGPVLVLENAGVPLKSFGDPALPR